MIKRIALSLVFLSLSTLINSNEPIPYKEELKSINPHQEIHKNNPWLFMGSIFYEDYYRTTQN